MKVILLADVPALGRKGEVKEVSGGYARNFLLARRLVEPATDAAVAGLAAKEIRKERGKAEEEKKYRVIAEKLKTTVISFTIKVGEKGKAFGSINALKIQEALAQQGVHVEKEWIMLDEPIKATGEKSIPIEFPHNVKGEIRITISAE